MSIEGLKYDSTTEASVEIIFAADDIKGTLSRFNSDTEVWWQLECEDSGIDAPGYDPKNSHFSKRLTEAQAAALMALFVGIGEVDEWTNSTLVRDLYSIIEPVFKGVHKNLRIIP